MHTALEDYAVAIKYLEKAMRIGQVSAADRDKLERTLKLLNKAA